MFEMLLTVCLADAPATCVERRLPFPQAVETQVCAEQAEARAEAWVAAHPDLRLEGWRCDAEPGATAVVEEIAPGVFVHQGRHETASPDNLGDLANTGFVVGADAVAVIDAGGSRVVAERLHGAIRTVTDKPIRWLILTHMHPDHTLGAEVFREAGATVIGHARLERALAGRAENYVESNRALIGASGFAGGAIILPGESVAARRDIDLGGRVIEIEAHATAHTDNDLSILDRRTGTLFAGDLLFQGHTPALDGSLIGWLAVLEALRGRSFERVVPGHGPASLPWPGGAEPLTTYLNGLAEETRAAIKSGATMLEASESVGQDLRGDWLLFEEFHRRNAIAAYHELEWE